MNIGSLVDYLKTQSDKGVSHVYLDQPSRDAIRTAVKEHRQKVTAPKKVVSAQVNTDSQSHKSVSEPPQNRAQNRPHPVNTPIQEAVSPESVPLNLPPGDQDTQLRYLKEQANSWSPATSLNTLRNKAVFSLGAPQAELMLIGDAPGFEEELKGEPFVGRAGQKLNAILGAMGLSRDTVYLTNICKFRPTLPGQTTNNRKPTVEETASCLPLLKKEIEIIKPKCIIALGATAAEALTGQTNSSAGRMRGSWYEFQQTPLRVTYHPSYLLRNEDNITEKRKLWEDMLTVMEELKLPISEKQRSYFT